MPTVTNEEIGARVRERRLAKKVSQEELAEAIDVTPAMVQHYETGRNPLTVVKLYAIADRLKCSVKRLLP